MGGKKMVMMQTTVSITVDSNKLKREFQKMSEGTRKIVDRILKQKIEQDQNNHGKSNGKKVIK